MKAPLDHGGQGTVHRPCGQITQDEHPCRDEGPCLLLLCRLTIAKMMIMGVAEGTIIATIIIDHMTNMCARSPGPNAQTSQVYIHPLPTISRPYEHVRPGKHCNQGKAGKYEQAVPFAPDLSFLSFLL